VHSSIEDMYLLAQLPTTFCIRLPMDFHRREHAIHHTAEGSCAQLLFLDLNTAAHVTTS
jgi:hypothetical protein